MPPAFARRLICGSHRCGKTTGLAEAATSSLHGGLDSGRILALSVHRQAVRALRAALHEQTGQELPAADVRRRATALLEQFPAAAGLPSGWSSTDIASALDRRMLMQRAWAAGRATGSLYDKYNARPGALDWLAGIFDLFAEWSGTADPRLLAGPAPRDSVLADLWATYGRYLGLCRQLQLVAFQEVVPRALDVLRDPEVRARVVPDLLLLDDLDLFRPSELLFAGALIGPATAVVATAGMVPSMDSPEPSIRFLDTWCAALGFRHEHPAAVDAVPVPPPTYVECGSPEGEADAIARAIVASFGPDSRFGDYAVVCFDSELIPILQRTLPQWNIAVEGMQARDGFVPAVAPLLHLGMRLIAGTPMMPAELAGYLQHPGLGLETGDAHMLAGELGGGRLVGDPLALVEQQARAFSTATGRQRLRQIAGISSKLRATEWPPSLKLRRWLEGLDCVAVTNAFVVPGAEQWELRADGELVERWLDSLRRSEQVRAALGEPLTDADAVDVLAASHALVEPVTRPLGDAVRLWQPDQLGGCSAPVVWLAGLHEHALPKRSAALAWVSPQTFAELGWLPGFVPPVEDDRAARWEQGRSSLTRAAGRATRRLGLSWSQTDRRGHRRLRSPLVDAFIDGLDAPAFEAMPQSLLGRRGLASRPGSVEPLLMCQAEPVVHAAARQGESFTTSPSAIEDFLICPRRYFYARVLNLYDVVASSRQALGQVVHAMLHELKAGEGARLSPATLVERHWPQAEARFSTRLREAAYRRLAEQAATQVASFEARYGTSDYVAGEAAFSWQIMPDVELRGKIDRIDRDADGLAVLDYKLGSTSPSVAALLNTFAPPPPDAALATWRPSDLQLPLYALAIEQGTVAGADIAPGERVTAMGLVYPLLLYTGQGKPAAAGRRMIQIVDHVSGCGACEPGEGVKRPPGTLCSDQLDRIAERARIAIEQMRGGTISPDPIDGPRTCANCAFRTICPAPQG